MNYKLQMLQFEQAKGLMRLRHALTIKLYDELVWRTLRKNFNWRMLVL